MERKKAGRLLATVVVALVAALGLVLGLGSTARADDTYTIAIINTNSSQIVYENAAATLGTAYTATLFGPDDDATISMYTIPSVFESVEKAGDKAIRFVAKSEGSDNMIIIHPDGGGGFGRGTTFAVSVTKNQDPVKYLDANDEEKTCTNYTTITNETTGELTGWYVVDGKVTITSSVHFNGDTHIILCDGAELNVKGLELTLGTGAFSNLTIYAQSTGGSMGKLVSKDADGYEAIKAGTLTINGGVIEAEGNASGLYGYTSVIINGGKLTCTGEYGIAGNSVMINGGTVTTAGNARCIYALGGEDSLTIAKGISVIEGDDEASAQPVADPSTWVPSMKWARTTAPVPVTSVELNPATATLEAGKTATLKATVMPDNATDKSVTWKSSNEKVATVKDGVVTAVAEGKATITATSVDNPEASAECAVTVKAAPAKGKQMFRLYNPNSGEHFYTANAAERDNVKNAGWTYEGVGWTAPESGSPVYRLYNEFGGEHHYTTSKGEHDSLVAVGWKDEGVGWYSGGSKPLYRQYNPNAFANNHNYTTSKNERDTLLGLGWRDEGIAWYGL